MTSGSIYSCTRLVPFPLFLVRSFASQHDTPYSVGFLSLALICLGNGRQNLDHNVLSLVFKRHDSIHLPIYITALSIRKYLLSIRNNPCIRMCAQLIRFDEDGGEHHILHCLSTEKGHSLGCFASSPWQSPLPSFAPISFHLHNREKVICPPHPLRPLLSFESHRTRYVPSLQPLLKTARRRGNPIAREV